MQSSEELSGRRPVYQLFDRTELLLTIFAAPSPHETPPAAPETGAEPRETGEAPPSSR